jgi:hypothetical protein
MRLDDRRRAFLVARCEKIQQSAAQNRQGTR